MVLVVVGVYYRRKELQDSSIGRRVLADTQRFLRWRSNAQVIAELHALGKFFGAIALLCLAVTMLGDRIFRAPMVESSIATIHLGFAWMSIYVVLDPHKFVRKSVREISTITLGGPSLFLILDVLPPGADTLDAYCYVPLSLSPRRGFHPAHQRGHCGEHRFADRGMILKQDRPVSLC